eukprot:TRINITY_DN8887_c0_g1_i3.p3 TRINITY_DN8887_c0_g1~~TRINITY_DN8887_c0_g1_i3.p3  ORF type:complete len:108 (-),score=7.33 TRINITY_DN8887_c0_g1_i3:22-345(-)
MEPESVLAVQNDTVGCSLVKVRGFRVVIVVANIGPAHVINDKEYHMGLWSSPSDCQQGKQHLHACHLWLSDFRNCQHTAKNIPKVRHGRARPESDRFGAQQCIQVSA